METLPCANEVAQMQEQQQQHQQQQQTDSLVNIKRVSLPFASHSLIETVMSKTEEVAQLMKQKPQPQHVQGLVSTVATAQLSNQQQLSSLDSLCESVVNIPKELILISLVSQEQALYNPKHQLYRSTKSKDEKWSDIGSHVSWTGAQCKAKWKAMRDQYCRELKRAKVNGKNNVKWKYFKELDFLRPFALARNYRSRGGQTSNGILAVSLPNVNNTANTNGSNNNNASNNTNNHNSFSNSNSSSQNLTLSAEPSKFANIKIEESSASLLENCSFAPTTTTTGTTATATVAVDKKTDTTRGPLSAFILGQIIHQQPQQDATNWNYLTETTGNGVNSGTSITVTCETPNTTAGDTLYNEFVDCVNAANAVNQSSTHNHQANADEEDDDPIHTFLNMESYFEKELITLIQQEDVIYNYSHQNYRNVKLKLEVWDEIARKLKKPVKQCRQKWKALRDQYAREFKRLKTQLHMDAISRWKHYDSLGFLQKYIQQKSIEGDALNLLLPKHDPVTELQEHMAQSPLRHSETQSNTLEASPSSSSHLNMPTLPPLTGPHKAEVSGAMQQQQEVQQPSELCVASYDEMDIENYINGDVAHDEEEDDEDEDMEPTDTTEQQQTQQQQHVVSYDNDEDQVYMAVETVNNALAKSEQLNETGTSLEPQQLQQQLQGSTDYSQKLEVHTPTSTSNRFQNSTTTPSTPIQTTFAMGVAEEDEIGAFFKAVAMKIRNAHLEPVVFTDLQIDILRVINDALRNH